jgi:regulator of RNase E activity RraA
MYSETVWTRLARYPGGVVESALALMAGRHQGEGVFGPGLSMRFPQHGTVVGTAVVSIMSSDDGGPRVDNQQWWDRVYHTRGPRVAVILDTTGRPGTGVIAGRLSAVILKSLGCAGLVTNGFVRDLPLIAPERFQILSGGVTVAHRSPHVVSFGAPVSIMGATVHPGDSIHASSEGVIAFPPDALKHLEEAAAEVERRLKPVLAYCRSGSADPAGIAAAIDRHMPKGRPWRPQGT